MFTHSLACEFTFRGENLPIDLLIIPKPVSVF